MQFALNFRQARKEKLPSPLHRAPRLHNRLLMAHPPLRLQHSPRLKAPRSPKVEHLPRLLPKVTMPVSLPTHF
jgi:hypothetical protein